MNKVAVLTYHDGTQQLKTLKDIFTIGKEYKQEWHKLKALVNWCYALGVDKIEVYTMDGKKDGWIVSRNI